MDGSPLLLFFPLMVTFPPPACLPGFVLVVLEEVVVMVEGLVMLMERPSPRLILVVRGVELSPAP